MTGERTTTHFVGDRCPGGHPELIPTPDAATLPTGPGEALTLLADLVTALHAQDVAWPHSDWSGRGQLASRRLHEAGIHTDRLVRTDWEDCPTCHMHPERHAGGVS